MFEPCHDCAVVATYLKYRVIWNKSKRTATACQHIVRDLAWDGGMPCLTAGTWEVYPSNGSNWPSYWRNGTPQMSDMGKLLKGTQLFSRMSISNASSRPVFRFAARPRLRPCCHSYVWVLFSGSLHWRFPQRVSIRNLNSTTSPTMVEKSQEVLPQNLFRVPVASLSQSYNQGLFQGAVLPGPSNHLWCQSGVHSKPRGQKVAR